MTSGDSISDDSRVAFRSELRGVAKSRLKSPQCQRRADNDHKQHSRVQVRAVKKLLEVLLGIENTRYRSYLNPEWL